MSIITTERFDEIIRELGTGIKETLDDMMKVARILFAAPYGATIPQIASLLYREEKYTQAIINILLESGRVREVKQGAAVLYKLNL